MIIIDNISDFETLEARAADKLEPIADFKVLSGPYTFLPLQAKAMTFFKLRTYGLFLGADIAYVTGRTDSSWPREYGLSGQFFKSRSEHPLMILRKGWE